jgi:hypothetical protein
MSLGGSDRQFLPKAAYQPVKIEDWSSSSFGLNFFHIPLPIPSFSTAIAPISKSFEISPTSLSDPPNLFLVASSVGRRRLSSATQHSRGMRA